MFKVMNYKTDNVKKLAQSTYYTQHQDNRSRIQTLSREWPFLFKKVCLHTTKDLLVCFFSINPVRGTKVEWKKNKKVLSVNPRVLTLIADLADHEWI
ncbi:hypothetical protein QTP70_029134 [Hemibagrus guttatus]|uniref:Uncharacterized protein n=1 Tax=Hemibagrus guttatus TaxID=175788 RepID=A0AAE0QQX2_9TELE|nr:hypothetical protein QTP70_029134 [Hemibagrus guttatus]